MAIKYLNWAWRQNLKTPLQKLVLLKLGDNADDTGRAFPSIDTMAKFTCASEKTVRNNLKYLEDIGLISIYKEPARSGYLRNEYQLNYEVRLNYSNGVGEEEAVTDTTRLPVTGTGTIPVTDSAGYRNELPTNHQFNPQTINHQKLICDCFEFFWLSGMRKIGKKASLTAFKTAAKKHGDIEQFTTMLINDVKQRVAINQFGFDKLHPERYLKNERWTDEVTTNEASQPSVKQRPLSTVERIAAANGLSPTTLQPVQRGDSKALDFDGEFIRK